MTNDIRFVQRFNNFLKAFAQLEKAVQLAKSREFSELEKQGLIQVFEYTHELSWNVVKDFLAQKEVKIYGSKDATQEAFKEGLITNGVVWMEMIKSRNETSHTYNQDVSEKIVIAILKEYFFEFQNFKKTFEKLKEEEGA